ncbi:hypothetical protein RRG08_005237 [Elysia crispata]|uniref:Uncharacterized protein n=1 Tax=Elysia crispata TaxID=231223 RepID=A0AAE1E147_9GAST|nr:hypothetical protein RRG08_005237 [Elysia crispata]
MHKSRAEICMSISPQSHAITPGRNPDDIYGEGLFGLLCLSFPPYLAGLFPSLERGKPRDRASDRDIKPRRYCPEKKNK